MNDASKTKVISKVFAHGQQQNETLTGHQPEDGTEVFKEEPPWQEVSCVQDNGREQKEEERIGAEGRGSRVPDAVYHTSHQEAHHDEETALRDDGRDSTGPVETCGVETVRRTEEMTPQYSN